MKTLPPVTSCDRLVANIKTAAFQPFDELPGYDGSSALGIDPAQDNGVGFHVFKMAPGTTTAPHTHECDEHFYIIEGDLTDHDGYEYHAGDIIMMRKGTRHWSKTRNGCVMVVYIDTPETVD